MLSQQEYLEERAEEWGKRVKAVGIDPTHSLYEIMEQLSERWKELLLEEEQESDEVNGYD